MTAPVALTGDASVPHSLQPEVRWSSDPRPSQAGFGYAPDGVFPALIREGSSLVGGCRTGMNAFDSEPAKFRARAGKRRSWRCRSCIRHVGRSPERRHASSGAALRPAASPACQVLQRRLTSSRLESRRECGAGLSCFVR